MREIADEVVTDFGIDAGVINSCAIVLLVTGIWHEVVSRARRHPVLSRRSSSSIAR
ncbi:MAG: hypothetical protein ACYDHP_12845 [Ferrimicrobium sp.]